ENVIIGKLIPAGTGLKARNAMAQMAMLIEDEQPPLDDEEDELPEPLGLVDLDRPDLTQVTDFSKLDDLRM
ncbi:MAG: hypothetical protein JOZ39_12260, partial [Chloroflexi bacterium]|nr:hypothetical protein [Chloroflexota bacterium]